jgi:hypothetical protein
MLGINAEDAMGLAEDMAVLRGSQPTPRIPESFGGASSGSAAAMVAAVGLKALQAERDERKKLVERWNDLAADYSDLKAVLLSARKVIEKQVLELAQATGADPGEVRRAAYTAMTEAYHAQVEQMLSGGELQSDPRKDAKNPKWKNRDWYISSEFIQR